MSDWTTGFALFRDTLPEPIVRVADPAGAMSEPAVRHAVALAVAALGLALLVRLVVACCERLWWRCRGLVVVEPASATGRRLRQLLGAAAVALPWLALLHLRLSGTLAGGWAVSAAVCWVSWVVVRAADHHRLAFHRRSDTVLERRGWATGHPDEQRWPLAAVLVCEDGRPLPDAAERPSGLRVRPHAAVLLRWTEHLGSPRRAHAWLDRLARTAGMVAVDASPMAVTGQVADCGHKL